METKSRYEVIADLEEKKRELIKERDNLDNVQRTKEKRLKELNRAIEDAKEDIEDFKKSMKTQKETTTELIKSVDASLERLSRLNEKKS